MVATRRSTRSQGPATPAASPSTPPAPAPKRQTRGKAKAASPSRDESPAKSTDASADELKVEDVTPSKRKNTAAAKKASPATRKKAGTPVKEEAAAPSEKSDSEESVDKAFIAVEEKSEPKDAEIEVATTPMKASPAKNTSSAVTATASITPAVATSTPTANSSSPPHPAIATDNAATPTKPLPKESPIKKATPTGKAVISATVAAGIPEQVTLPKGSTSSPSKATALSETESEPDVNANAEVDDDDEDVEAMVNLALSSFTGPSSDSVETTEAPIKKLVSNRLDSGVTTRDLYITFNGNKCAKGAQLASERKIVEELKQFAKTQKVAAVQDVANTKAHSTKSEAGKNQTSSKWFNMVSNELTAEAKRDIQLIKMRNYIDPKRFYKSSDLRKSAMPKVFQVGTVIEGAAEFKSARLSRKDRHQTFTEEILHDKQIGSYTKRKYGDIQASKANHGKNKFKKAKHQANRK